MAVYSVYNTMNTFQKVETPILYSLPPTASEFITECAALLIRLESEV